jgi:hypothetical protein
MVQYVRTDRLGGMSTSYSYFGGNSCDDAPICLGEVAEGKFYLESPGERSFYQQPDGSWSQDGFGNPNPKSFPSFLDLLNGLSIELLMESGEKVIEAAQAKTPLSKSELDRFPAKADQIQSFENFNVMRHGIE